jgi:uncharacterized protein (DUF2345 family)
MPLEAASFISQLNSANPLASDPKSEGDDQIRLVKAVLKAQFPNFTAAAVTPTVAELNHVQGVSSPLQTQLNTLTSTFTTYAPLASPILTGTPTAPTATAGTSTTQIASTAFVQAAIAGVNAQTGVTLSVDSAASITATAGQHIVCTNAGTVTVTLPASPSAGQTVWVTVGNGRTDTVIARNGQNIMSLAEDMTVDNANVTVQLRFINSTLGWRLV